MGLRQGRKDQRVHGVSFETAAQVFDDPNHVVGDKVIHLISARKAVDYEESIYNDQFR